MQKLEQRGAALVIALLVTVLALACGTKAENEGDALDAGAESEKDSVPNCENLSEEACRAEVQCAVIEGWTGAEACTVWNDQPAGPPVFAGCRMGQLVCTLAVTWVSEPGDTPQYWLFSDGCTPHGWPHADIPESCTGSDSDVLDDAEAGNRDPD